MSPQDELIDTGVEAGAPAGRKPVRKPVTDFDDPRSRTIAEFCDIEGYSLSSYFALKRRKLTPEETRPPGTKLGRISRESHADWRRRMAELAESEAGTLEAERRRRQTQEAAQRSLQARTEAAA